MAVGAVSREGSRNVRSSQRAEQAEARRAERAKRQEARRAERERQSKPVEPPPVQQQPPVQQPVQQQPTQQTESKPVAEESRSKNFIGDLKGARVVNFAVQGGRNSNSISVFASGQGPNSRPDSTEKKSEATTSDSSGTVDVEA